MKVFLPVQGSLVSYNMAGHMLVSVLSLDMTESKAISDIVVSSESIRVRSSDSSQSISWLLSGTVDVAVAKGVVLVLVLGVELAGGDGGDSSTGSSNNKQNKHEVYEDEIAGAILNDEHTLLQIIFDCTHKSLVDDAISPQLSTLCDDIEPMTRRLCFSLHVKRASLLSIYIGWGFLLIYGNVAYACMNFIFACILNCGFFLSTNEHFMYFFSPVVTGNELLTDGGGTIYVSSWLHV